MLLHDARAHAPLSALLEEKFVVCLLPVVNSLPRVSLLCLNDIIKSSMSWDWFDSRLKPGQALSRGNIVTIGRFVWGACVEDQARYYLTTPYCWSS